MVDCTVEGVEDEMMGEAVKVAVVVNKGYEEDLIKEKIINFCEKNLSKYKIPKVIEIYDKLFISSTGKKLREL